MSYPGAKHELFRPFKMRSRHHWRQNENCRLLQSSRITSFYLRCNGENPELGRIQINDFRVLSLEFCSITSLTLNQGSHQEPLCLAAAQPWPLGESWALSQALRGSTPRGGPGAARRHLPQHPPRSPGRGGVRKALPTAPTRSSSAEQTHACREVLRLLAAQRAAFAGCCKNTYCSTAHPSCVGSNRYLLEFISGQEKGIYFQATEMNTFMTDNE